MDAVKPLVRPARLRAGYYARFSLHGRDYPAVVPVPVPVEQGASLNLSPSSSSRLAVDGLLFRPQNRAQRARLDDFEGETYRAVPVEVEVLAGDGDSETGTEAETVDADIYVWDGAGDDVSGEEWDFEMFVRERLDDWLELFGGIELVGDEDEDNNEGEDVDASA